jgi:histidyl-tRNA synthetase
MSDTGFRPQARSPRGFADKRARDLVAERRIVTAVSAVYERFGFEPLDTPAFEYADALGKFLPDSDRPNEGVFALQDDDEQWMALRYDLTAPLARFAAQNWESLPKPFRRYAFGTVWRNEKPGPGRYREFVQCDADTLGSARPEADAEIIAMVAEGLEATGLKRGDYVIKISSRRLLDALLDGMKVETQAQRLGVLRAIDKLDRLGIPGVAELLGPGRLDESGDFTKGAGLDTRQIVDIADFLAAPQAEIWPMLERLGAKYGAGDTISQGFGDLDRIAGALRRMGVGEEQARLDPSIVRGLEYYTGAVFEADLLLETTGDNGELIRFGSVGGGGRYDDLVARFTGEKIPATGFSFGVSRLAAALRSARLGLDEQVRGPVVVIAFSEDDMGEYVAIASELRRAGIAAEVYLGTSGMRPQMKYADRRTSPAVVIAGSDEIAAGTVTIKDLDLGRRLAAGLADNAAWRAERPGQITVPRSELVGAVRRIVES